MTPWARKRTKRSFRLRDLLWCQNPGGRSTGLPLGGTVSQAELLTETARVVGIRSVDELQLYRQQTDTSWQQLSANLQLDAYHYLNASAFVSLPMVAPIY